MSRSRVLKKLLVVILATGILVAAISAWATVSFDWNEKSVLVSPKGNSVAFVMESRSEAGVAPYGEHVVIRPSWQFFGQYFIAPVFVGYCRGGVRLNWSSDQALLIQCTAERIVKQVQEANGVRIEYVITQ